MVSQNLNSFKAIVIVGATASGKTALAHWLADEFARAGKVKTVLVNLDAFQIYKEFDVGTAKPSAAERQHYRYKMLDVVEPHEGLDARAFAEAASNACHAAFAAGDVPICVGGSGLYLRAFLHGLDDFPERNDSLRDFIRTYAERWGWPALHVWLQKLDATRAAELHQNDKTRIERALEIIWLSGKKVSETRTQTAVLKQQAERFENFLIQVDGSDAFIKNRVATRTAELFKCGWVEEVRGLVKKYGEGALRHFPALRAIGYKEILDFLTHEEPASETALQADVLTKTWQYARRQRTWNAKEKCDARFSWEQDNKEELFKAISKGLV